MEQPEFLDSLLRVSPTRDRAFLHTGRFSFESCDGPDYEKARNTMHVKVFQTIKWQAFEYYPALEKIQTYVVDNPSASLSLSAAAAIANMERTHFSKYFHKKTGVHFKYWEDFRKIQKATRLFDEKDISVTEAAFAAGFRDLTTFERTFKRITGTTPRAYKKACSHTAVTSWSFQRTN